MCMDYEKLKKEYNYLYEKYCKETERLEVIIKNQSSTVEKLEKELKEIRDENRWLMCRKSVLEEKDFKIEDEERRKRSLCWWEAAPVDEDRSHWYW